MTSSDAREVDGTSTTADPREPLISLFRDLRTSALGLSDREAQRRLLVYGPNELPKRSGRQWPGQLLKQVTHPLALVLVIAAVLAWFTGTPVLAAALVAVISPPSDSHVDCAAAMSLRPAVRRTPARSTSWTVKYGPSAAGVDLPIAALLPTTRAWMTRVIRVSLSARRSGPLVGVSYLADHVISNRVQANGGSSHCCAGDCSWGHASTSGVQVAGSARALLR